MVDGIQILLMVHRETPRDPWECDWSLLDLMHLETVAHGTYRGREHFTALDVSRSALLAAYRELWARDG